jgi:hypothetical protein
MQPCDVGLFQPYKHWQNIKLNEAIAQLAVEYNLESFLRDESASNLIVVDNKIPRFRPPFKTFVSPSV